jgi:quinol-cytochrome oxidoreductase complex cytochrome b subunit
MTIRRWSNHFRLSVVNNHLGDYPSAVNGSYYYSFGSRAGLRLVVQLVTGIFLARHYTPHVDLAFNSVEHIRRDVNYGWLRRYLHANGASFFFIVVYAHIRRGLYYGSYAKPREHLWRSGLVIFIARRGTGFIGYVLPFGQRSLWGATVITNLASAVPLVGDSIVEWLWGGFSVDNATLNRFFSLHYLLPFVIVGLAIAHLALLHEGGVGSTNPLGTDSTPYRIPFYPYFYMKDLTAFIGLRVVLSVFVFFAPNALGHPDNYIEANPRVTPAHIVPEWYFLRFYAILRSIPHKLLGVVARGLALVGPRLLPYLNTSEVRATAFRPFYRVCYWVFVVDCVILGWIGQKVVEYPYVEVGQVATVIYFGFLFVAVPLVGRLESYLRRYQA